MVTCTRVSVCYPSVSPLFLRSFPLAFPHSLLVPIFSPTLWDSWSGENCYWGLHDPAPSVLLPEQGEGALSTELRWPNGLSLPLPSLSWPLMASHGSLPSLSSPSPSPPSFSPFTSLAFSPPSIPAGRLLLERQDSHPTHAKSPVAVHHQVMVKANTHLHCLLAVSSSFPLGLSRTWAPPRWPCQPWLPRETTATVKSHLDSI